MKDNMKIPLLIALTLLLSFTASWLIISFVMMSPDLSTPLHRIALLVLGAGLVMPMARMVDSVVPY